MKRSGVRKHAGWGLATSLLLMATGTAGAQQQVASQATPALPDTSSPIGWVEFCEENPGDCNVVALKPTIITLQEKNWREIVKINANVNREIDPVTDKEHHGVAEKWSYPDDGKGDCEDYVLEKRRRLMRAGFPRQALLVTVVRDKKGDGHAVLTIRTDRGDFILDNQEALIREWKETGYRFIKRQSQEHPNRWVSLGGYDTSNVAGTKR